MRLPAAVVSIATVVGFAATGVPAAVPGGADGPLPTVPGLVDLFSGVALGWRQLLTISLPVGSYEALLVPYFVSVLLVTVVGVSIATRASRPELASLPALALFVTGTVFGPTRLETSVWLGVLLTGIALVWALTVRHLRRAATVAATTGTRIPIARAVVRPALVGTATIAAAAVVATGLGFVAPPAGTRTVARSGVVKPFDPRDQVSPLSGFRAYEERGRADQPQLTVTGLPAGGFVRIATLDSYDGVVYRVGGPDGDAASGSFERVPTTVDTRDVRGDRRPGRGDRGRVPGRLAADGRRTDVGVVPRPGRRSRADRLLLQPLHRHRGGRRRRERPDPVHAVGCAPRAADRGRTPRRTTG
ncbi:transglutaminaseTgpA domain-containing protein [Curtobacterium sp. MCPF17_052]|uniref:transglutaminaseTgpA domain-containing protein n=1 Tax=Curtobacterium sp. MCPF17_052 TaxID=2175655 RepID=UPI0024DFA753|nr:transglutaminaseTgpA domain-containing protein [Curtobacterium sp. MCPF17_052]WIB12811.1 transglutaminaseTgpA domain-containing protein [Curtobacterium sp. MCPF17_052]